MKNILPVKSGKVNTMANSWATCICQTSEKLNKTNTHLLYNNFYYYYIIFIIIFYYFYYYILLFLLSYFIIFIIIFYYLYYYILLFLLLYFIILIYAIFYIISNFIIIINNNKFYIKLYNKYYKSMGNFFIGKGIFSSLRNATFFIISNQTFWSNRKESPMTS